MLEHWIKSQMSIAKRMFSYNIFGALIWIWKIFFVDSWKLLELSKRPSSIIALSLIVPHPAPTSSHLLVSYFLFSSRVWGPCLSAYMTGIYGRVNFMFLYVIPWGRFPDWGEHLKSLALSESLPVNIIRKSVIQLELARLLDQSQVEP